MPPRVIEAAAGILRDHPVKHVVLDTILASTSGTPLLAVAVGVPIRKLLRRTVLTRTRLEAAILLGDETGGRRRHGEYGPQTLESCGTYPTVHLKGGHLGRPYGGSRSFDGKEVRRYESPGENERIRIKWDARFSSLSRQLLPQRCSAGGVFRCARLSARRYSAADRLFGWEADTVRSTISGRSKRNFFSEFSWTKVKMFAQLPLFSWRLGLSWLEQRNHNSCVRGSSPLTRH